MMSTSRLFKNLATCQCRCMVAAVSCNSVPSMSSSLSKNITTTMAPRVNHQVQEAPDNSPVARLEGLKKASPRREFYKRKLPDCCISFCSTEGKNIFTEALHSGHMDSFFPLAAQFRTQEEPAYCGLATLVMVLNTLEVDPKKVWKGPWRWYHENMLDCCIPLDIIGKKGITMDQFACLAACNMLQVKMVHVDREASEGRFRDLVKSVTKRTDQVLVTSYSRITLEQSGDGHFSPIGGYNPDRDMVLIMDTARFKYPPHWVSLSQLFKAMQVVDPTTNLPRGYFMLSKNRFNPGLLFRLSSFFSPLGKDVEMVSFFNAWEDLLATVLTRCDMIGSDVAEMTLVEVLRLMSEIKNDVRLLTLQLDSKFAEELSYQCYSKNVIQMIESLESLPFYSIISHRTSQNSSEVMFHAGLSDVSSFIDVNELHHSETLQDCLKSLTSSHFLAVFMLSWPYHRCRPGTLGAALHKYFASQLSRPNTELLQNECARIRQQLSSIIGYAKKCSKICCS